MSIGADKFFANLLMGSWCAPSEVSSTSKGSSFFLQSADKRILLKGIKEDEAETFQNMLEQYLTYVTANPNSLLCRCFGLYRMKSSHWDSRFITMANLFDTDVVIHEVYDLKGSSVGRYVDVEGTSDSAFSIALKDMNFQRKLHISPERRALLLEQLERDCRWLEERNIIDYSLLLGIHYAENIYPLRQGRLHLSQSGRVDKHEKSIFKRFHGGIPSSDGKELYFIGIIDIFTLYNLKKRSESTLKSIIYDKDKISCISPPYYRRRFVKLACKICTDA